MVHVKLPWELVEEILYRVHQPQSIIRLKIVCKQWKTLIETKSFANNHLVHGRPQFFLWNDSKMYSVNVTIKKDPEIEVRELPFVNPFCDEGMLVYNFLSCEGLLSCEKWSTNNKVMAFNPWLNQTRLVEFKEGYMFDGLGYDSGRLEKGPKIFGTYMCDHSVSQGHRSVVIYNFKTNELKHKCFDGLTIKKGFLGFSVSLNGNSYWIMSNEETGKYVIQSFDFLKEIYKEGFCILPWDKNTFDFPTLSTFRKDRLLVLTKFNETNNFEILVTRDKVNIDDGDNVKWMKFMTVSVSSIHKSDHRISYFIDDGHKNSLVMCCKDKKRKVCIYIVRDTAVTKIPIGVNATRFFSYVPSLVPVP